MRVTWKRVGEIESVEFDTTSMIGIPYVEAPKTQFLTWVLINHPSQFLLIPESSQICACVVGSTKRDKSDRMRVFHKESETISDDSGGVDATSFIPFYARVMVDE